MNSATAFGRVTGSAERPNEEKAEAVAGEGERKGNNGNACSSLSALAISSPWAATRIGPAMVAHFPTVATSPPMHLALTHKAVNRRTFLARSVPSQRNSSNHGGHNHHGTFCHCMRAATWSASNVHAELICGPDVHSAVAPAAKGDHVDAASAERSQDLVGGHIIDRSITCIAPNGQ